MCNNVGGNAYALATGTHDEAARCRSEQVKTEFERLKIVYGQVKTRSRQLKISGNTVPLGWK